MSFSIIIISIPWYQAQLHNLWRGNLSCERSGFLFRVKSSKFLMKLIVLHFLSWHLVARLSGILGYGGGDFPVGQPHSAATSAHSHKSVPVLICPYMLCCQDNQLIKRLAKKRQVSMLHVIGQIRPELNCRLSPRAACALPIRSGRRVWCLQVSENTDTVSQSRIPQNIQFMLRLLWHKHCLLLDHQHVEDLGKHLRQGRSMSCRQVLPQRSSD